MFVLVSFDISDDRIRYRAVKLLKGFGVRVQKSVFECPALSERQYLELKDRMEAVVDQRTDSVRYYILCKGCIGNVEWTGLGCPPEGKEFETV